MGKGKKGRAPRERWKYLGTAALDGHTYYQWRRGKERYYWLRSHYIQTTTKGQ